MALTGRSVASSRLRACRQFSSQDDASDLDLFNAVGLKVIGEHVSAIMLPDGSIFGRRVGIGGPRGMLDRVSVVGRSEEHTSELQSLMRISYAVFCLKKKITKQQRE